MPPSDKQQVDELLQRFCEGCCTPEERAYIEGNTDLLARVAAMQREDVALQRLFAASIIAGERPSPEDLIAYVDGTLSETRKGFVQQCAQRFPEVREEIRMLQQLGPNPLTSE